MHIQEQEYLKSILAEEVVIGAPHLRDSVPARLFWAVFFLVEILPSVRRHILNERMITEENTEISPGNVVGFL